MNLKQCLENTALFLLVILVMAASISELLKCIYPVLLLKDYTLLVQRKELEWEVIRQTQGWLSSAVAEYPCRIWIFTGVSP